MQVKIEIDGQAAEPRAVIYTAAVTAEVREAAALLAGNCSLIPLSHGERVAPVQPEQVTLARIEGAELALYTQNQRYTSKKRLYEMAELLGPGFVQISRSALVNLAQVSYVEPYFDGVMLLKLKDGREEYISRKYLPGFKKRLGL